MTDNQLKKIVLLNRKLMNKRWYIYNGYGDEDFKLFYSNYGKRITVSINTYNGYIEYRTREYSEPLTLQETIIFYKVAGIFRKDLEAKIGKRL